MKRMKKIVLIGFLALLFCFTGTITALAGVDLGAVSLKKPVSATETVESGSEKYLMFSTSSDLTDYKLIVQNVNAPITAFDMTIYLNDGSNTAIFSKSLTTEDKTVTETLSLAADTSYYIELKNSSTTDGSVLPEAKITISGPKSDTLTLNKSEIVLKKGRTITLKADYNTDNANKRLVFVSSDPKVAKVSSKGVVKAVNAGTAVITCSSKTDSTLKASCKVTVKKASANHTSDVTISVETVDNVFITYQYSGGNIYAATCYYTLKVGAYKGKLDVTFHLTEGSDTQTISVEQNSVYLLSYQYAFKETKGTTILEPVTTYQYDPISKTMKAITTYKNSTIPAPHTESDLSVTVSGIKLKNIVSDKGSFKKGTLTCEKK